MHNKQVDFGFARSEACKLFIPKSINQTKGGFMKRTEDFKPPDGFYTTKQAAEKLQCYREYLYILAAKGKLKMYKRQGYTLLLKKEVDELIRPKRKG